MVFGLSYKTDRNFSGECSSLGAQRAPTAKLEAPWAPKKGKGKKMKSVFSSFFVIIFDIKFIIIFMKKTLFWQPWRPHAVAVHDAQLPQIAERLGVSPILNCMAKAACG